MPEEQKETEVVRLAHGSGGEAMGRLIRELILPRFDNPLLHALGDSAVFELPPGARLAFTTDSYVVDPVFFPGGDIGYLAVCGTVNDLAMAGARPLYLSAGLIVEEGLPMTDLERVLDSMARAAGLAGVQIVAGDTKVVARGAADKIFINTAGVGLVREGVSLGPERCRAGDAVLVSGPVGSHGIAVMAARQDFGLETGLTSDVAPLAGQVQALLEACPGVRVMRDPTRGGLAGVLTEIAAAAGLGVELREAAVPGKEAVRGACEILGFDPLFIANEGVFAAVVPAADSEIAVGALKQAGAAEAAWIGRLSGEDPGTVSVETVVGGRRIVVPLGDELLPRIC
ncbi:MAG: hydrogenase expression/formation protein HypE [Candidatus Glassbacteria bacterium]|nr:hydrogenase expression/formation protein HypE [Candidatus Glassbacteria bacterium]